MPRPVRFAIGPTRLASSIARWVGSISHPMKLRENLEALLGELMKAKPTAAKGIYMQKVTVSSTMGPGLTVDHSGLSF